MTTLRGLIMPDMVGAAREGFAYGAEQKRQRTLAEHMQGAIGGDKSSLSAIYAADPGTGFKVQQAAAQQQEAGLAQEDKRRQRLGQMARQLTKLPPEMRNAAYQQMIPELSTFGLQTVPPEYTPEVDDVVRQVAEAFDSQEGVRVQSTFVDAQGNRVAILRDGSTQVLGQNAPQNQIIDTGNGFFGVNKGSLQAAPVMIGGAPQQAAPQTLPTSAGTHPNQEAVIAQANQMAQQGLPSEQIDSWIQTQLSQPVETQGGQQLRSAPKAHAPSELERRLNLAGQMGASPDELRQMVIGRDGAAAGAKPMPTSALKMIQEETNAANTANAINKSLSTHLSRIESGKLRFGMASNLLSQGRIAANMSDEEDRNWQEFRSDLERLRNDSLRLNAGVQTDGDAQRAWNELVANLNDTEYVKQRLQTIKRLNERAEALRRQNIEMIRENYGQGQYGAAPPDAPSAEDEALIGKYL